MSRQAWHVAAGILLLALLLPLWPVRVYGGPPVGTTVGLPEPEEHPPVVGVSPVDGWGPMTLEGTKIPLDWPNPLERQRIEERMRLLRSGNTVEADLLAKTGTEHVLVILSDFGGTDVVQWNPGEDWDPLGIPNYAGPYCDGTITQTTTFTYTGPLHNDIARPPSADDRAAHAVWTEDFNPEHYMELLFGDGILISYTTGPTTTDTVIQDLRGYSMRNFYWLESDGRYTVTGDVIGWVHLPHSLAWYGADGCPGARSGGGRSSGAMPGGGGMSEYISHTIAAVNAAYPNFDWSKYDADGDGLLDRVLLVHAWLGEEDSTYLLDRPAASGEYVGEHTLWSHKSFVNYPDGLEVAPGIALGPYTLMPENGGTGVFAHEYAHDLGTMDLYAYGYGETSAGFWTLMADDWGGGDPYGAVPPELDPMHKEWLGWLSAPTWTTTMPPTEYLLGESSNPPPGMEEAVIIELPDQVVDLPVQPYSGNYYYWGGQSNERNAIIEISPSLDLSTYTTATLSMMSWWDIEDCWDFGFVQVSTDGGNTWRGVTGTHTTRDHDPNWYFTEEDLPGLTGYADQANSCGPDHTAGWHQLTYTLTQYVGLSDLRLRLRYGTDWAVLADGWYIDDIAIDTDAGRIFFDDLESGEGNWQNNGYWYYSDGTISFPHRYYVQWRNRDGFDGGLVTGRYGIQDFGMILWYNNERYDSNEIWDDMTAPDGTSLGPKGRMLVVDAHFQPWRDPDIEEGMLQYGWEEANLWGRIQHRDAAFGLNDTQPFTNTYVEAFTISTYPSRPAVSAFHDSLGYYPGLERSPSPWDLYSATIDWDTSVVIPAPEPYGVAPPDYQGPFQNIQALASPGMFPYADTQWYPDWQFLENPWFGGTGNPGENNYGVHIKILEQAPDMSWARIRVWYDPDTFVGDMTVKPEAVCPGDQATFYLTIKDSASYTYTAAVTITLPPSVTLVTGTLAWSGELGGKVLHTPDAVLSFTVQTNPDAIGRLTAVAQISGSLPTKTYSLESSLWVQPRFGGDATAPTFINAGDTFTYTIAIKNEGCAAGDPWMVDNIPGEVEFVTVTGGAWYSETVDAVLWGGEPLAAGEERTFHVVVSTSTFLQPGTTIENPVHFQDRATGVTTLVYAWTLVQPAKVVSYNLYLPLVMKAYAITPAQAVPR